MLRNISRLVALALSIAVIAPAAAASELAAVDGARDLRSPAVRAAERLRADKNRLTTAQKASILAEEAAKRAQDAVREARRALATAREAAEKAVVAAREAKLALETARAAALRPSGPLPDGARGGAMGPAKRTASPGAAEAISPDSPAARAFRKKVQRETARAAKAKPRAAARAKPAARAGVLRVGPGERYRTPSKAASRVTGPPA